METTTLSPTAESSSKPLFSTGDRTFQALCRVYRKSSTRRSRLQRFLFGVLLFLVGAYALNALILFLFAPQGIESGSGAYRGSEVIRMESISVGIGPFSVEAAGYVNMASTEDRFYISDVLHDDHGAWEHTAYSHESFHLIQRDLVTEAAGGSPSYLDPVRSFIYYFQLLRLNAELAPLMPEPADPLPLTGGLEGSADCYAQPRGTAESPAYYTGVYIREDLCTPAQVWIVDQMAAGNWPEAPSEAAALPELFVEGGFPSKSTVGFPKDGAVAKPILKKALAALDRSS